MIYRHIIPEINQDLQRYAKGKKHIKDFASCLSKKEYRSVFYYRLPFLLRNILNLILRKQSNCYIHTKNIGSGLYIQHGFSTIIVAQKIGKNPYVHQNVTIGWDKNGKPTIGDNVSIFPGAVIAGKIKIGNNVRIAANTVVRHDIPDNCLVYGNPCIIRKEK